MISLYSVFAMEMCRKLDKGCNCVGANEHGDICDKIKVTFESVQQLYERNKGTKQITKLTEGDVGNVGEDAPPCRDEAGVFAPEDDESDVLAIMAFKFSSSPNKEFLPNAIPFVIFKCCVIVRARDVLLLEFGIVTRGGKETDSDKGELPLSSI